MKKFILFSMALIMSFVSVNAQTALQTSKVLDNVGVGVTAGVSTPLDFNSVFPLNTNIGVKVTKDFTPVIGMQVEGIAVLNDNHFSDIKTSVKATNVGVNGVMNLSNLIGGFNGTPRMFEVSAVAGLGWLHAWTTSSNYLTAKTGVDVAWNIGKTKAHSIVVTPAVFWNLSKNGPVQFDKRNAQLAINVSYIYHFKTSNGTHHFTYARLYDQNEIDGLNDKINNLRGELDGKDNDLKAANNRINDLNNEVERLKNRKPNEVRVVETVTQQTRSMESVVTFRQGKSTVDNAQLPNVERVATYLNNHKDATVIIRGFASPEGSQEVNERIAKARAEAVKDILVKRYRINASRIDAQGNGVGDMFSEPDWNRVSICTIDDKEK